MKLIILAVVLSIICACGKVSEPVNAPSAFDVAAKECAVTGGVEWMFNDPTCGLSIGRHCLTSTTIDKLPPNNTCQAKLLQH